MCQIVKQEVEESVWKDYITFEKAVLKDTRLLCRNSTLWKGLSRLCIVPVVSSKEL